MSPQIQGKWGVPLPDERYDDGEQSYYVMTKRGPGLTSLTIHGDERGWMYSIPELGIGAGAIHINGVPVSGFEGSYISIGAVHSVKHDPSISYGGLIEIECDNFR